jgi:hypothetical protein
MFQRFTVIVNNMRANVVVLPYDDHDRAIKPLHSLDRTVWSEEVEAILESEKYETLMVFELFSKLKSSEVDHGVRARIENPTDPHSQALISGSRTNVNPSSRMYSLSSLVSFPDEDFDVFGEDDLALLSRRFERMYENRMSARRNSRTCFKCGKTGHFFTECSKLNDDAKHKSKDKRRKSKKKDHGQERKTRSREKMNKSSDVESDSEDTSSSSSDEEEEGEKKEEEEEQHKKKKNLRKYLNDFCVMGLSSKDDFYSMARSSSSKISQKDASDSDSEDEVRDELSSLRKDNEVLVKFLDNRNHMLREAKKHRKKLRLH